MSKILWVEGIVGMGKSTFAQIFSEKTDSTYLREPVDENPYLQDFYEDMHTWAFPMQMELLYRRFQQHWEAQNGNGLYVMDRGITGDSVFADMLWESGHIGAREYNTYCDTHKIMTDKLQNPSLIVYLNGTPERALEQLRKRDRAQETSVTLEYLTDLNKHYDRLFFSDQPDFIKGIPIEVVEWYSDDYHNTLHLIGNIMDMLGWKSGC